MPHTSSQLTSNFNSPSAENARSATDPPSATPQPATPLKTVPTSNPGLINAHNTPVSNKIASQASVSGNIYNRSSRFNMMRRETEGKIVGPMPAKLFLDTYLRTKQPIHMNTRAANTRSAGKAVTKFTEAMKALSKKEELEMYPIFVDAANELCLSMRLVDTHDMQMETFNGIVIRPDVCAYEKDCPKSEYKNSTKPLIMMEFKDKQSSDPFTDPTGDKPHESEDTFFRGTKDAKETLGQIASYAAAHQSAQFTTHIFSVLVVPTYSRILYWDRSGVVVTQNISHDSDALAQFLQLFDDASSELRGIDVTVREPTPHRANAARQALSLKHDEPLLEAILKKGEEHGYIFAQKPYMCLGMALFGRSTRACQAYSTQHQAVVFFKDTWRIASQIPEHEVYKTLHGAQVPHIATALAASDVDKHHTQVQNLIQDTTVSTVNLWGRQLHVRLRKHAHYRLILKEVGKHLKTYQSTKQLVTFIREAMTAHQMAYSAGILHRDISINNIMIYSGHALLIDWDLCKGTVEKQSAREIERTGTWQFIAARLLLPPKDLPEDAKGPHNLTDDLESFVHLLTWMAFRYTSHDLHAAPLKDFLKTTYDQCYDVDGNCYGGHQKSFHLMHMPQLKATQFDNPLLLPLLRSITKPFGATYVQPQIEHKLYDDDEPDVQKRMELNKRHLAEIKDSKWLIGKIDFFLEMEGWFDNDTAVSCNLPMKEVHTNYTSSRRAYDGLSEQPSSGKRQKRSHRSSKGK